MATAPPPAKIKAHLATIKEQFLDDQEAETAKNPEDLYHGLLSMELLLRGVIVQDNSKLWQQVQASIGKVLLTTDNTPKPLLAGAHVMAGRVAEACPKIQQKIFSKDCTQALQRAQDIKDERWLILLKQEFDPLQIAQGYFVGAALIQTDTPPMWKKVWDLWSQRTFQSQPFEAQVALENLMRIAASKGNQTRVAELQLQLIQSYLNKPTICNDLVSQAFGDTVTPKLPSDPQVLAEVAKKTLFECQIQDLAAGANLILYQILQVQVGMALETATIQRLAQEKQTLDKNRSVSTSIETCLESSRQDILSQSLDSVQMQALSLRDTVVAGWSKQNPNDNDGEDHWSLAVEWTRQSILRLFDRAEAAQKVATNNISTTPWKIALEYILPIMETIERQCDWSLGIARTTRMGNISQFFESTCSEEKMLVSLIVSSLPNVCWMLLAMENNNVILEDKMIFLLDSLSVLIQSSKTEDNQPKEAIGSKQQLSTDIQSWKLAQAKATCYICQDNNDIVYQVTRDAVVANKQCQDGSLGFLQCIVAWSGLYQRPWPFCSNISDARRLLRAAKVNGGRSFSTLEEILLDLAHSDAELLNGGFASDAGKRYSQIMHKLEAIKDILGNLSTTLLQAHCINGLARVCQMGVATPEQASVEEYAMKSLQLLESIEMSSDIRPLHIWYSRSLFAASISHQLSVARQLIADSLVHDGRCEEAQSFLEAAVNDAPLDADAALALGAFLLRLAFYSNTERSVEVDKAAQIQLLKAAKLDPSKANPFALLGLWFEEQGDSARAQGCYLKSLNLDSCNPVAGRGMLRLESRENLGQYLDSAVNSNSPLNGWAWRSIGLNKVFLDSEDELAVVALLKSLRCRDIALPASEPLGIFFQRPTESNINERENALAEVAMCYRRLGRYTASIRAFHAAIETAGDSVGSSLLCSCAQGMYFRRNV